MAITYPYLRAWGHSLGSSSTFINDQVALATADGAPHDVIYVNSDEQEATSSRPASADSLHVYRASGRVWHRYSGIVRDALRADIAAAVARLEIAAGESR